MATDSHVGTPWGLLQGGSVSKQTGSIGKRKCSEHQSPMVYPMYYSDQDVIREGDTVNLVVTLRVLWRHKYLIAFILAVAIALALVVAFTTTPTYRATVVVVPTAPDSGMRIGSSLSGFGGGLASLAGLSLGTNGPAADAEAVLHSRHLVAEFVRRNGLVPVLLHSKQHATLWFAVKRFQESVVSIATDKEKGTTTISIRWTDPQIAARWANGFVALANELLRTRALQDATRNINYLKGQLAGTHDVALQNAIYDLIQEQTRTLMLANARIDYAFTSDDPAVSPETRYWPNRKLILASGAVLGLLFGAAVALVMNAVRRAGWTTPRRALAPRLQEEGAQASRHRMQAPEEG